MKDWHLVENNPVLWLVDGLLPADGFSAIIAKPKGGKSTSIRDLTASVIKSRPFLGRQVNIPIGTGRVLYVHLDRKDKPARVVQELRTLGITADEAPRLALMVAADLPASNPVLNASDALQVRLVWLQREILKANPHLVVIDLLQQFLCTSNVNDYSETISDLTRLQDALTQIDYKGAFLAAIHSRKASSPDQPFDDTLGSTGLRGSFTTLILLRQYRTEGRYTIMSDQTEREEPWNEIEETTLVRNPDGTMTLGRPISDLHIEANKDKRQEQVRKVLTFISDHPGCNTEQVITSLAISKAHFLEIVDTIRDLVITTGLGIKGDPKRYSLVPLGTLLPDDNLSADQQPATIERFDARGSQGDAQFGICVTGMRRT
jgi:hypothetical protein